MNEGEVLGVEDGKCEKVAEWLNLSERTGRFLVILMSSGGEKMADKLALFHI